MTCDHCTGITRLICFKAKTGCLYGSDIEDSVQIEKPETSITGVIPKGDSNDKNVLDSQKGRHSNRRKVKANPVKPK